MKIYLFVFFLTVTSQVDAQISISQFNISHLYDPQAEIGLIYTLETNSQQLTVHAQLTKYQDKANISDYEFSFYMINSYGEKLKSPLSNIDIDSTYLGKQNNKHFITFKIPRVIGQNLLVVKVLSKFSGYKFYYDVPLARQVPITVQTETGTPIIETWFKPGRYKVSDADNVFGFYYDHQFPIARPPMVTKDRRVSRNMRVDSTFSIRRNETFILKNSGLYLLQEDTTGNTALSFRLEDKYFPKSTKLDQLVDPLIYITTKNEKQALEKARDSKAEFDQFWIDLTRSSERARDIIKKYYDRVESANQLFTTYKAGWKTDRGMIYIVFGPPEQVLKTNQDETWVYLSNKDHRKLEFKFVKASSIFSNSHYALVRDKMYADSWFKAISRIRQGQF